MAMGADTMKVVQPVRFERYSLLLISSSYGISVGRRGGADAGGGGRGAIVGFVGRRRVVRLEDVAVLGLGVEEVPAAAGNCVACGAVVDFGVSLAEEVFADVEAALASVLRALKLAAAKAGLVELKPFRVLKLVVAFALICGRLSVIEYPLGKANGCCCFDGCFACWDIGADIMSALACGSVGSSIE